MVWHPLILAVLCLDLMSLLLFASATATAFRIVLHWAPQSPDRRQIELERTAETASIQARFGAALFLASTLLLVAGIVNVLPSIVPGAMCGTGVLQATNGLGERALVFRIVTLTILFFWYMVEKLNRTRPDSPLTHQSAKIILLLAPVAVLAFSTTLEAAIGLNIHKPVDCCAVVYDSVRTARAGADASMLSNSSWMVLLTAEGILLLVLGLRTWLLPAPSGKNSWRNALLAVLSLVWVPVAYTALIRVLAAYHYGVLHHFCPWCLFLREHGFVGYALFGALIAVALEGSCSYVALAIAHKHPQMLHAAVVRSRAAGFRLVAALAVFLSIAGLPAILWRVRFGVWL